MASSGLRAQSSLARTVLYRDFQQTAGRVGHTRTSVESCDTTCPGMKVHGSRPNPQIPLVRQGSVKTGLVFCCEEALIWKLTLVPAACSFGSRR